MKHFMRFSEFLKESNQKKLLQKRLLLEGGADGHMHHIWETDGITFSELREIFKELFTGQLSISEKCLSPDTIVILENSGPKTIQEVVENKIDDKVLAFNEQTNETEFVNIEDYVKNAETEDWLEITLENGKTLVCTPNHRIYVNGIDKKAEELKYGDELIVNE